MHNTYEGADQYFGKAVYGNSLGVTHSVFCMIMHACAFVCVRVYEGACVCMCYVCCVKFCFLLFNHLTHQFINAYILKSMSEKAYFSIIMVYLNLYPKRYIVQ